MITSFSNPNYQLNDADALNSNLPASQYYHDNGTHIYDEPANLVAMDDEDVSMDTTTNSKSSNSASSSSKRRKKYAHMDADTMGVSPSHMTSPESMTSSEEQYSVESGFLSPGERTASMVEIEHNELSSTDSDGGQTGNDDSSDTCRRKRGGGFLGYYASLEKSVKERNSGKQGSSHDKTEAEEAEDDGKSSGDDSGVPVTPASAAESNASGASGASRTDKR